MAKILIADDDERIRELLRHFLVQTGFEVLEAEDGLKALNVLESQQVSLVILDIMMPNMDGWQVCEKIKKNWDMPVLMLTAKAETAQKLKGFDLGTDDYLIKPFDPLELVARVKVLLKRYKIEAENKITLGLIELNRDNFIVKTQKEEMTLPLKEFNLLFKLASYPGRTFTREQLIESLWGNDFDGNERTLDVHINRLRSRFSEKEYGFSIRTIRGLGYRIDLGEEK